MASFQGDSDDAQIDLSPPPRYNPTAKKAKVIGLKRSSKSKKSSKNLQRWTCQHCQFNNRLDNYFCRECCKPRYNKSIQDIEIELPNDYECIDNLHDNRGLKYISYLCFIISILVFIAMIATSQTLTEKIWILALIIAGGICFLIGLCLTGFRMIMKYLKKKQETEKGEMVRQTSPTSNSIIISS